MKQLSPALQPGQVIRVNRVTFCPGHDQPGLTRFIKYPGLTQIWHRITCVIIMTLRGDDVLDDVSISCQHILKRVIFDGVEAPRKVTRQLYGFKWLVQQQPWLSCVARPYDAPDAYQYSIVAVLIIGTLISARRVIWQDYTLYIRLLLLTLIK